MKDEEKTKLFKLLNSLLLEEFFKASSFDEQIKLIELKINKYFKDLKFNIEKDENEYGTIFIKIIDNEEIINLKMILIYERKIILL